MSRLPRHHQGNLVLILALLVTTMTVGLGSTTTQAQYTANISMWLDTTDGAETANCIVDQVINPFNAHSGTVEVEATLQAIGWDATRTALVNGAGPDIVITPGPSFANDLAQSGHLLPLDDFATAYGWSDSFAPWALQLGTVDGQLYSIPNEVETLVLYYNKTLFEKHGWDVPKTLDELMTLSADIENAGIIPFAHTNAEYRLANTWFVGELLNHGAGPDKVYRALTGEANWTDPEFVAAIDLLTEMQQNGWFMGGTDQYYTTSTASSFEMLANGEAAMKIEGTWAITNLNTSFGEAASNDSEWDWAPVPSTSGDAIYDLGIGSTYSINRDTESPEAAAEFLDYLFSPEVQATLAVECGQVPAPVGIEPDQLDGLDPRYAAIIAQIGEASQAGDYGYTTWTFWPPRSSVYIYEAIESVWEGDMTAEEYLQGLQTIFDEEMTAGDVPPIPER